LRRRCTYFRTSLAKEIKSQNKSYSELSRREESGQKFRVPYVAGLFQTLPVVEEEALFFYFEDAILDGVKRASDGEEWPENAMPVAERPAAIAAIDARILELERERAVLAEQLVEAGLAA
jgi:hypothetical protein